MPSDEQQTCGGWFFIKEYITFRYVKTSGKIVLHKYGRVSTDRRDPNKVLLAELYTAKPPLRSSYQGFARRD